jgi:hypothetical protein
MTHRGNFNMRAHMHRVLPSVRDGRANDLPLRYPSGEVQSLSERLERAPDLQPPVA